MFKFLVFLFLCLIFFQPEKGIAGTKEGLMLWYNAVLPAQLPFVMGVKLVMRTISFDRLPPALISFAAGLIAGYPVGSMTTAQLYKEGYINKQNLTSMAAFNNMAGPLFVLGTVGTVLLGNMRWGYMLLTVHWISAAILSVGPGLRERKARVKKENLIRKTKKQVPEKDVSEKQTVGNMLGEAIGETAQLMLKIACFIVLFSVLKQWIGGIMGALLEMSGGVQWLAGQDIDMKWKLVGCSFLINFSGLCVILQSLGAMEDVPVSVFRFTGWKILQGIVAAGIMLVICQFLIL